MVRTKLNWCLSRIFAYLVQMPRIVIYSLVSNNHPSGRPRRCQPIQTMGMGKIRFENNVNVGVLTSPEFFSTYAYIEARFSTATILIGSGTWINNNFCAIADYTSITIGRNCLIGTNVEILDSNFHGVSVSERKNSLPEFSKPVSIGDDVFIGSNVKIMRGVSIGNGSVVANGSTVTKNVPANVVVGGCPAILLKEID